MAEYPTCPVCHRVIFDGDCADDRCPYGEQKRVDLADVFGYGPSSPGWAEPISLYSNKSTANNPVEKSR